jgi:hypothetical protein
MLTSRPLFQGENVFALYYQHAYTPAPPVHEINPAVPEVLAQITARALAKKPEERYQSAREMAQALEAVLSPPAPDVPSHRPRSRRNFWLSSVSVVLLTILLVVAQFVFGFHLVNLPGSPSPVLTHDTSTSGGSTHTPSCTSTQAETKAQSFEETFQDNQRGWEQDNSDVLTSTVRGNAYMISVAKDLTYFLCPSSMSSGMLPENFSLTAQIAQKQGRSDVFYGLAFRLGYEKDVSKVYSYALVINGQGDWLVLKYDPHVSNGYSVLKSGTDTSAIHNAPASNTLEVIVQGSKFLFKINDTVLPINGLGQADQSIIDQSYTGGQLALLVSGPNASFVVTSVKLIVF